MKEGRDSGVGKSYWFDLRLIREAKGIGIDTVHEHTRVPVEILSNFEHRGFPDRKRFNSVYRRSMVAAYARAIDIDPDDVLRSAEETEIGRYRGRLACNYLGAELKRLETRFEPKAGPVGSERAVNGQPQRADGSEVATVEPSISDAPAEQAYSDVLQRTLAVAAGIIAVAIILWLIVAIM